MSAQRRSAKRGATVTGPGKNSESAPAARSGAESEGAVRVAERPPKPAVERTAERAAKPVAERAQPRPAKPAAERTAERTGERAKAIAGARRNLWARRTESIRRMIRDIIAESRKINWPDQQTTRNLTIVVIGISVVLGAILGGIDFVLLKLIEALP